MQKKEVEGVFILVLLKWDSDGDSFIVLDLHF
jgi:hypothetical protein